MIRLAATLTCTAIDNQLEAGFGMNALMADQETEHVYVAPSSSQGQKDLLMEVFAHLSMRRYKNFQTYLSELPSVTDTDYLLLSFYKSESIDEQADILRSRGNSVQYYPIDLITEGAAQAVRDAKEREGR